MTDDNDDDDDDDEDDDDNKDDDDDENDDVDDGDDVDDDDDDDDGEDDDSRESNSRKLCCETQSGLARDHCGQTVKLSQDSGFRPLKQDKLQLADASFCNVSSSRCPKIFQRAGPLTTTTI